MYWFCLEMDAWFFHNRLSRKLPLAAHTITFHVFMKGKAMKSRELALVAVLMAIGAVLYLFMPNIGTHTIDTVATFTVLAILLVRPKPLNGMGIGVVAGMLGMVLSKSPMPWLNLLLHPFAALSASLAVSKIGELKVGKIAFCPVVATMAHGLVGAGIFMTSLLIIGVIPFKVYVTILLLQIPLLLLLDITIIMVLYPVARSLYDVSFGRSTG